jgi:cytochrome c oxidase subunit 2
VHVEGVTGEPPTLVLPLGETVEFTLTSPDVIHSFWVPDFIFKMDVFPNDPNVFQVKTSRLGEFAGRCAELCGKDHSLMLFTLKIVTPEEYDDYIQGLAAAGLTGFIMPELMDERPGTVTDFDRVAPGDPR